MKAVPILHELDRRGIPRLFVHTGQHYDVQMSEALLRDLDAPPPDVLLDVGSASHAVQTARVMERFETVLLEHCPAWVVLVGDVNSTLACALVTAKLREQLDCRIAHVEAGLRSRDWRMPEEVNRVLTDRLSDLLLTPVEEAADNLVAEGMAAVRTEFVGNVMIDALLRTLPRARAHSPAARFGLARSEYVLATLHRPSNVDNPAQLRTLIEALAELASVRQVLFPMHPRTHARAAAAGLESALARLLITEPFGYADMVGALDGAALTITDSGGVQQESTVLGVPCLTLREQTEWSSTVTLGTNRLAQWPATVDTLLADARVALAEPRRAVGAVAPAGWDGRAALRIVDALSVPAPATPTREQRAGHAVG